MESYQIKYQEQKAEYNNHSLYHFKQRYLSSGANFELITLAHTN